mmetsp:Transcript_103277/g.267357  ORF Transcript_103277/g.267357 Transcript_103277/m.267357 type:complete len:92 (+) Transcript_103277:967-1242(+)
MKFLPVMRALLWLSWRLAMVVLAVAVRSRNLGALIGVQKQPHQRFSQHIRMHWAFRHSATAALFHCQAPAALRHDGGHSVAQRTRRQTLSS